MVNTSIIIKDTKQQIQKPSGLSEYSDDDEDIIGSKIDTEVTKRRDITLEDKVHPWGRY